MKHPKKLNLANLPTPLEQLSFEGKKFLMKRDDYTGLDFSGNKIRKLEYLLYRAKQKRTDIIFTCGGEQSNHCRAAASAAAKLGIKTRLFLWGNDSKNADGNLLLDKLYGAQISFLNKKNYENVNNIMTEESEKLTRQNKKVYVIPEGGSTTTGIWGYISFMNELKKQVNLKQKTGILCAAGTGGTAAGMLLGAALNKLNLKIFAVNVLYPKEVLKKKIMYLVEGCIADFKMNVKVNFSNLEIIDGYSKEGYKNISDGKLKLINKFAASSGIVLDPAYTGKAFNAYHHHFLKKGKGMKVIFLHTGGMFGVFSKRSRYLTNI